MAILNSIQTADRVFDTNTRPVLIMCDDMNDYVCKYQTNSGSSKRLFCEYLAASFLKLWNLKIPDFAFVKINRDHIPPEWQINGYYFDTTCFGLRYNRTYEDVTKVQEFIRQEQRKRYTNRLDLLKIGLFDIWIANEDRHHNNYNLLIDVVNERNFIPIDHEAIFNSQVIDHQIQPINEDESLICTKLILKMFSNQDFNKDVYSELKKYFYLCTQICKGKTVEILSEIPTDWRIDKNTMFAKIEQIFSDRWIKSSYNLFLTFLQYNLNK